MTTTRLAAWRNTSAYMAIYTERIPKPAFGGLDQSTRLVCIPLSRDQAEEMAQAQEQDMRAPLTAGNRESDQEHSDYIPKTACYVIHPSIRHAYIEGLVYAVFGTGILWIGILGVIWAVRGLLSW